MIISHTDPAYVAKAGPNPQNGAYHYSCEIVRNMIPRVSTDRPWVTINTGYAVDGAIVFIHNNLNPEHYDYLSEYDDLVLVCGIPETVRRVSHLGAAIYVPLSIDVAEVMAYTRPKDKLLAVAGRRSKIKGVPGDRLTGIPREKLLARMARYRYVFAVGRCAIEARALGCEVLAYDPRFPDPSFWKVLDNAAAADMLQMKLDAIDGGGK